MNVTLTPQLERLVHKKVKAGRYTSASEVVREALRSLEERDIRLGFRRQEIRSKISEGLASLRRGEGVDGEQVFRRLDAELAALEKQRAK